jgi:hypothetical protein
MIGVDMGLDRPAQREPQLVDERRVAAHLLEHRIDDHRVAGVAVGEKIGIGRGLRVEHLPEDQHPSIIHHGGTEVTKNSFRSDGHHRF